MHWPSDRCQPQFAAFFVARLDSCSFNFEPVLILAPAPTFTPMAAMVTAQRLNRTRAALYVTMPWDTGEIAGEVHLAAVSTSYGRHCTGQKKVMWGSAGHPETFGGEGRTAHYWRTWSATLVLWPLFVISLQNCQVVRLASSEEDRKKKRLRSN